MSSPRKSPRLLQAVLFALMIVPPISFVASIGWLRQQPDSLVLLLSGIAAVVTIVASLLLAILHDRSMDEWQRSNTRFSSQWGWTAGACMVSLLISVSPVRDWIVSVVADVADVPDPNAKLVIIAFTFGFMAVVITQLFCTILLSTGWVLWKSRGARDPA